MVCLGRGYIFVPMLLCILKEILEAALVRSADSSEHETEILDNVQKMFQKILESMAFKLRRQQGEGIQVPKSYSD